MPLTIAIATNDGWLTVRQAYDAIRAQAEEARAEVILVDGSGGTGPRPAEIGPTTRWLEMPGPDIAEMRARAYREASGRSASQRRCAAASQSIASRPLPRRC